MVELDPHCCPFFIWLFWANTDAVAEQTMRAGCALSFTFTQRHSSQRRKKYARVTVVCVWPRNAPWALLWTLTKGRGFMIIKAVWCDTFYTHFCTQGEIQRRRHWYLYGSAGKAGWRCCSTRLEPLYLEDNSRKEPEAGKGLELSHAESHVLHSGAVRHASAKWRACAQRNKRAGGGEQLLITAGESLALALEVSQMKPSRVKKDGGKGNVWQALVIEVFHYPSELSWENFHHGSEGRVTYHLTKKPNSFCHSGFKAEDSFF